VDELMRNADYYIFKQKSKENRQNKAKVTSKRIALENGRYGCSPVRY